jgi:hypothetical protein
VVIDDDEQSPPVGSRVVRPHITSRRPGMFVRPRTTSWSRSRRRGAAWRHTDRPLVVRTSAKLSGVVGQLTGRAGEVAICMDFDGPIAPDLPGPGGGPAATGMVELLGRWPTATPPWP